MKPQPKPQPTGKIGKRNNRRKLFIGLELDNGWLQALYVVDLPFPSKYRPHQGAREKARRLKQERKQAT